MKRTVSFVGAGALASGMAWLLHERGCTIGEIAVRNQSASLRKAGKLARAVQAQAVTLPQAQLNCDVLWLAVPDEALAKVAKALSRRKHLPRIVLHASGAMSSAVLEPLRLRGVLTGSAHPMMSFVAGAVPSLEGAWFAVEGDDGAVREARRMARLLGARSFALAPEKKALYHAFGAMLSPMLTSQLEAARQLGVRAGIPEKMVAQVMAPIVRRTVENVFHRGSAGALSGPLARGDVKTVAAHLEALKGSREESPYRALTSYALQVLPVARRRAIKKLLGRGRGAEKAR